MSVRHERPQQAGAWTCKYLFASPPRDENGKEIRTVSRFRATTVRSAKKPPCAARVRVFGIVQGVGFRPFVHRLAGKYGLAGTVLNFAGGVEIELEGERQAIEAFLRDLRREAPPIAVIDDIAVDWREPVGLEGFRIIQSKDVQHGAILISPDVATCAECERELFDPNDRRYLHPFINCTNCGPRFTIVKAAPYDRPLTSMGEFEMCPRCRAEYEDITNRRYHAQPNACHDCGPRLEFRAGARRAEGYEAIVCAAEALRRGEIVAVKGLGGFHLACDARSSQAVARLRRKKRRSGKAFAIMVDSLETVRRICHSFAEAEELLCGPRRPIVLLPQAAGSGVAPEIAPDVHCLGVMLPYTPVHHLLMRESGLDAVVMTSGNLAEEPLCTDNEEAQERLAGLVDCFLLHNREIVVPCDDSVVRPTRSSSGGAGPTIIVRRARGYVPFPVRLAEPTAVRVLAVGGHLKNTFCLTEEDRAFLSQHIGDLDDARTLRHFHWALDHLCHVLRIKPEVVAHDMHPDYLSTQVAAKLSAERGWPRVAVQHHHAHVASCMAEHGLRGPVLGVACDGVGYGEDGTVWGCELLVATVEGFRRVGHLREIALPGGEAAIRDLRRAAVAYLAAIFGPDSLPRLNLPLCRRVSEEELSLWLQMIERGINAPRASSAGRLFDVVAAVLDLGDGAAYEGQPAMKLEALAWRADDGRALRAGITCEQGTIIMDGHALVRGAVEEVLAGVPREVVARRFHNGFVALLAEGVRRAGAEHGLSQVVLSGGTFQNELVLVGLSERLRGEGFEVFVHREVPPNDGGISLGQAVVAAARCS